MALRHRESRVRYALLLIAVLFISALVVFGLLRRHDAARVPSPESSEGHDQGSSAQASPPVPLEPNQESGASPQPSAVVESSPDTLSDTEHGPCAKGMRLVEGDYCPFAAHACLDRWNDGTERCKRFANDVLCDGRYRHQRFCIDLYEYPNLRGVKPVVYVDFEEAREACGRERKRLCTLVEWEFACEGEQITPYPYGLERDATACVNDRATSPIDPDVLQDPFRRGAAVLRGDGREPSGANARCKSPFGIFDTSGNVDEWVENVEGREDAPPYLSALKGGAWGSIPATCRHSSTNRDKRFRSNRIGFRCCADAGAPNRMPTVGSSRGPRKRRIFP